MPRSKAQKGGRKGWTTVEQHNWLHDQIPTYLSQRVDGRRLNMFWLQLFSGWFKSWPEAFDIDIEAKKLVRIVIQPGSELIELPVKAPKAVVQQSHTWHGDTRATKKIT